MSVTTIFAPLLVLLIPAFVAAAPVAEAQPSVKGQNFGAPAGAYPW